MTGASPGDALPPASNNRPGLSGLPDQGPAEEDVQEPVAAAAAHVVGEADGAPTDGQDEELREALAAETEHKVWQTSSLFDSRSYYMCNENLIFTKSTSKKLKKDVMWRTR